MKPKKTDEKAGPITVRAVGKTEGKRIDQLLDDFRIQPLAGRSYFWPLDAETLPREIRVLSGECRWTSKAGWNTSGGA
jgi:hypothetical protein